MEKARGLLPAHGSWQTKFSPTMSKYWFQIMVLLISRTNLGGTLWSGNLDPPHWILKRGILLTLQLDLPVPRQTAESQSHLEQRVSPGSIWPEGLVGTPGRCLSQQIWAERWVGKADCSQSKVSTRHGELPYKVGTKVIFIERKEKTVGKKEGKMHASICWVPIIG